MSLRDAFLQDILEHPDEVAPRLVYADWLDEHGDEPDRAEFIRTQCELDRLPEGDPARAALDRRCRLLLKTRRKEWTAELTKARLGNKFLFRRGFVEGLTLTAERFVVVAPKLFQLAPVRLVHFPYAVRETSALAASEHLARLTGAGLDWMCTCGTCPVHDELRELFESPHAANLTTLVLSRDRMNHTEVGRLCRSPYLVGLEALDLSHNVVGGRGLKHLGGSRMTKLARLDVGDNELTLEDVKAVAEGPRFAGLRSLSLRGNDLGVMAARLLAGAASLANLLELNLSNNRIGDNGAKALAASPHLEGLLSLDVRSNELGKAGVLALRERFGKRVKVN